MKLWTLVVAATCLATLMPASPAASVTISTPYDGPAVLAYGGTTDCSDPVRSVGIACVDVPNGAKKMEIAVRDASGLPVGGAFYLSDAFGNFAGSGLFCGTATIPLGTAVVGVVRLEAVNGPLACQEAGQTAGTATQGVIAMRLR